jgi:hypothetical protein
VYNEIYVEANDAACDRIANDFGEHFILECAHDSSTRCEVKNGQQRERKLYGANDITPQAQMQNVLVGEQCDQETRYDRY